METSIAVFGIGEVSERVNYPDYSIQLEGAGPSRMLHMFSSDRW